MAFLRNIGIYDNNFYILKVDLDYLKLHVFKGMFLEESIFQVISWIKTYTPSLLFDLGSRTGF